MVIVFVFEPFSIGVKISEEPEKKTNLGASLCGVRARSGFCKEEEGGKTQ